MHIRNKDISKRSSFLKLFFCLLVVFFQGVFSIAYAEQVINKIWNFDQASNYEITGSTSINSGLAKGTVTKSSLNLEQEGLWADDSTGHVLNVVIQDKYAYQITEGGLYIIDINNPNTPVIVGIVPAHIYFLSDLAVVGNYAFFSVWVNDSSLLQVVDISSPHNPTLVDLLEVTAGSSNIGSEGGYAYVVGGGHLQIINVNNPDGPLLVGSIATPGGANSMAISGNYAYVADGEKGLQVFDISFPTDPTLVSSLITSDARDISLSEGYAYVADSKEGVKIIDISQPTNPALVSSIGSNFANGIDVSSGFMYVADLKSLRVFDVSTPTSPIAVKTLLSGGIILKVKVDDHNAYVAGYSGGLKIFDISTPSSPIFLGKNNTQDQTNGFSVQGNYAYIADGRSGLKILDISTPSSPSLVGSLDFPNTMSGSPSYVRDVSVKGSYAYIANGREGLKIVDISNPTTPQLIGSKYLGFWSDARKIKVLGNYAYIASGQDGLNIIDISLPDSPILVGNYLTPRGHDDYASDIDVSGNYVFLKTSWQSSSALHVINISTPSRPRSSGQVSTLDNGDLYVLGNYAYIAVDHSLKIFDISIPNYPRLIGSIEMPYYSNDKRYFAKKVKVIGNYAYVLGSVWQNNLNNDWISVIDISTPSSPKALVSSHRQIVSSAKFINITGDYIYTVNNDDYSIKKMTVVKLTSSLSSVTPVDSFTYNKQLTFFSEKSGTKNQGNIHYQLIVNDTSAYYHNGTSWEIATDETQTNTATEINQHINSLHKVAGFGVLNFKAYFTGNEGDVFELDSVSISSTPPRLDSDNDGHYDDEDAFPNDPTEWADNDQDGTGDNADLDDDNDRIPDAWETANGLDSLDSSDASQDTDDDGFTNLQEYLAGTNPNDNSSVPQLDKLWGFDQASDYTITDGVALEGSLAKGTVRSSGISLNQTAVWTDSTYGESLDIDVQGQYAYVVRRNRGLAVIDISNPSSPVLVGSTLFLSGTYYPTKVVVLDNYAYVSTGIGLQIIDISIPSSPTIASYIETERIRDIRIVGNNVYMADDAGLIIVDISTPTSPVLVKTMFELGRSYSIEIVGNNAYVGTGSGLKVVDISSSTSPTIVGSVAVSGNSLAVYEGYIYVTGVSGGSSGLHIVDIHSPSNPVVSGFISITGYVRVINVSGNYIFVASEYGGLQVIDISSPLSPSVVASKSFSSAYDVSNLDNYAYVVNRNDGSLTILKTFFDILSVSSVSGFSYNQPLTAFEEVLGANNQATVGYQLIVNDSVTYYHNGANWVASTSEAQTNTATEINQHIGTFHEVAGFGELTFKAYFTGNEGQIAELDSVFVSTRSDSDSDGYYDDIDVFPNDPTEWADNDNDSLGDNADLDDDNDGMPDTWEIQYGLNPLDASDALLDNDDDGVTNIDEYNQGTVPTAIFTWDIDGDGQVKPLTDGLLTLRYLFGFRGDALTSNAIGANATRSTAEDIEEYLQSGVDSHSIDIDGDGKTKPLTDGLLLLRYQFGFRGDALVSNSVGSGATRDSSDSVSLYIDDVNGAPVASNVIANMDEDTSKSITLNGRDSRGNNLSYIKVTDPVHGVISTNGNIATYTPNANYNGADSFTYKVNNGTVDSNIAIVTINVNAVNDAPVVNNVTAVTDAETVKGIILDGADSDGDSLTYIKLTNPAHGSVSISGNIATYTPEPGYSGDDSFTYKVTDGSTDSNTAIVNITVNATNTNSAPIAYDSSVSLSEDNASEINLLATDVDDDTLTFVITSQPGHGSLVVNGNKATYTPDENYNGEDSFSVKANDGSLDSNVATTTITISPVNDAPVIDAGSFFEVLEGSSRVLSGTATDVDGDSLTYLWEQVAVLGQYSQIIENETTITPTLTAQRVEDGNGDIYTLRLTVSDNQGSTVSDTLSFRIVELGIDDQLLSSNCSGLSSAGSKSLNLMDKIELYHLESIKCVNQDLSSASFQALENLPNLGFLTVNNGSLTDINSMQSLVRLKTLDLARNAISNMSALSNLVDLTTLDLSENSLTSVVGLNGLSKLTSLDLSENSITDISSLDVLINLIILDLSGNNIVNISSLDRLEKLTTLNLSDNNIVDIRSLIALSNLEELELRNNSIDLAQISSAESLSTLGFLDLRDNQISDVSALASITSLFALALGNNQISDIGSLSELSNLFAIEMGDNSIVDITALASLTNLEVLYLSKNQVRDISALSLLSKLDEVELDGNQIADISPLANASSLTELSIKSNLITDVSAFINMDNTFTFYIDNNCINDVSVLPDNITVIGASSQRPIGECVISP